MSWVAYNTLITAVLTVGAVVAMLVARRAYKRTRGLQRALEARVVVEVMDGARALRYLDASVAQLVAGYDYSGTAEVLYLPRSMGAVRVVFLP